MTNWQLIRCAFGYHRFGSILHDDFLNRWIRICKVCNKTIKVDAPKDDVGEPIDPHVWLQEMNERDMVRFDKMLKQDR